MAKAKALTSRQMERIVRNVVLGVAPPKNETPEARAFRIETQADVAKIRAQGLIVEIPFDLSLDDE